jgi:hypothetical protein
MPFGTDRTSASSMFVVIGPAPDQQQQLLVANLQQLYWPPTG